MLSSVDESYKTAWDEESGSDRSFSQFVMHIGGTCVGMSINNKIKYGNKVIDDSSASSSIFP